MRAANGDLAGWLISRHGAAPLTYATTGAFQPSDFAALPSGDVLALERSYTPAEGVAARLVRIARADIRPGVRLAGMELARPEPPFTVDNFEGLAVAPAPDGGVLVYVVSDDNFSPVQRTLLLLFRLDE